MAKTPSNMIPLGTSAPDFSLPDTNSGKTVTIAEVKGEKGTLVMFISNHCPFVKLVKDELLKISAEYPAKGVGVVAIGSNDVENYPDDSPELMAEEGYPIPYLYDESQSVAKAYNAACTPDFYLFDSELKLAYRGQLDGARPGNEVAVTGEDLRAAMNALVAGTEVPQDQKASLGCNIKWK